MDFSFIKSFKYHGSFKRLSNISEGEDAAGNSTDHLPILTDHEAEQDQQYHSMRAVDQSDQRKEVTVNIDTKESTNGSRVMDQSTNNGGKIWRESSIEFWNEGGKYNGNGNGNSNSSSNGKVVVGRDSEGFDFTQRGQSAEDPPSKLIGQFLHKQRASGDFSLDMDLEMDELRHDKNLAPVTESPMGRNSKELRVSFQSNAEISSNESVRRRSREAQQQQSPLPPPPNDRQNDSGSEVLKCTSNESFHRKSSLLRAKTNKSRLMDPPEEPDRRSGRMPKSGHVRSGFQEPDRRSGRVPKSGQLRSGFVMSRVLDDEDDDPFLDEDLPDEYKRDKLSALTLLEWLSLVVIIAALVCTLSIPLWRKKNLWKLKLWKWEVMILVLICGRLVSGWGIRVIVFFIERNFLLRKRVLYFVYGIKKAVQNCLWLGLVLIAWHLLFDKKVERETKSDVLNTVTKILICLLVGTLVWLVKTLMVKVLASSFHVSTYFDRIQESLFNQYVIETLSGPPLIEIQKNEEDEKRLREEIQKLQNAGVNIPPDLKVSASSSPTSGKVIGSGRFQKSPRLSHILSASTPRKGEEGISIGHLHRLSPKNVSAWNMKRLINIVRYGALTTLDEQIQGASQEDESATQIRSEYQAKAAAKKIFLNVARNGSRYIYMEDLMRFLNEDEALKTMSLFEGASESKKICKSSLKNWVVNAFRERRALALTLNDTKTAVNKLHRMVNALVCIVILVIWLLILGIATTKFLLLLSSQLVLAAFIFGNTCKTVFEAIIFLFVMHPFDVGDRCEIDGVQMVVEEMSILTTTFLRYDNQKITFPNSVLAMKAINNYYRSPDMGDAVEFCVHISTPADKIAIMRQRIVSYIEDRKEHWYPAPMIILKDVEEFNRIRIAVWLTHRMNHQDMGERWVRRSHLVEEMVKIFKELDIQYRLFPLDINVRTMPLVTSTRVPPTMS